LWDHTRNK